MRILIIDDEPDILVSMSALLQLNGYEVRTADNGRSGVQVARDWQPDLVLMDLNMPEMDGVTATGMLRFASQTSHALIVATSTYCQDPEWRRRAFAAGVDDCVDKPLNVGELKRIIARRIGPRASGDQQL